MMKLWIDQEGLTSVEYALLLAVVVVVAVAAWRNFGTTLSSSITNMSETISGNTGAPPASPTL